MKGRKEGPDALREGAGGKERKRKARRKSWRKKEKEEGEESWKR